MSKKVLNIDSIKNELEGASLYFSRPVTPLPPPVNPPDLTEVPSSTEAQTTPETKITEPEVEIPVENTEAPKFDTKRINERSVERTNERTFIKSTPRSKIRHTFDIFADQLLSLREIALQQEIMYGERVLLGDLAQQALDMLITKEKNK